MCSSCGVVVITWVSQTQGPWFDSWLEQFFFHSIFFLQSLHTKIDLQNCHLLTSHKLYTYIHTYYYCNRQSLVIFCLYTLFFVCCFTKSYTSSIAMSTLTGFSLLVCRWAFIRINRITSIVPPRGVAKGGQGGAFAPPSLNDFFF